MRLSGLTGFSGPEICFWPKSRLLAWPDGLHSVPCPPTEFAGSAARLLVALGILLIAIPATCFAADKIVVALGASHTFGKGVNRGQDYPAQLQNLLTQKGFEVQVINSGVNGQTTGKMLVTA